jgi:hypothetical protein
MTSTRTEYRVIRQNLIIDSLTKLSRLLIKDKKEIEKLPLPTLKFINILISNPTEKVSATTYRKHLFANSERVNSLSQQLKKLDKNVLNPETLESPLRDKK